MRFTVATPHSNGWMVNTVEHRGLDGGVVNHVFEEDALTYLQGLVEAPRAHVVATEAGVTTQAVDVWAAITHASIANDGLIGHLQTVGHVAGEAHVEDGSADTAVFNDIDHLGAEYTSLPSERRAGLQDDTQVGIAGMEPLQEDNEMVDVIVLAGHEVATAQVEPLQLGKPTGKTGFEVNQGALQLVRGGLAVAMTMKALDALRELVGQLVGHHAKASTWGAGVIEFSLDLGVFGIDTQAAGDGLARGDYHGVEALELGEGVEGDVTATAHNLGEIGLGIGG